MNPPEIKYLTDATGHPTAVVIPIELWRQLLPQDENAIADLADRLEDYCLDKAMTAAKNTPLLNRDAALQFLESKDVD